MKKFFKNRGDMSPDFADSAGKSDFLVKIDLVSPDVSMDSDKAANYTASSLLTLEIPEAISNAQLNDSTACAVNTM